MNNVQTEDAALFCLANGMQFSANFFNSLEFLVLLFQDKSTEGETRRGTTVCFSYSQFQLQQ